MSRVSRRFLWSLSCVMPVLATLQGCGGLLESAETETPTPTEESIPPDTQETVTTELSGDPVYFSLASNAPVTTSGNDTSWDLRFDGRAINLNGGEAGPGEAWGFGPVGTTDEEYEALTNHNDTYIAFEFYDEFSSVMTNWYAYVISGGSHGLYSRYHVYAVQRADGTTFKVQLTDYYADVEGSPESGIITMRYANLDGTGDREVMVDARAGGSHAEEDDPANKYTYFNLADAAVVELTDEEAASSSDWDIAFKRYYVKLNGGVSGPAGVVGYDFQGDREETNSEVIEITEEQANADFVDATAEDLEGAAFTEDRIGSVLEGCYLEDENGTLQASGNIYIVVGADGKQYYKMRVTQLTNDGQGQPGAVEWQFAAIQ